MKQLGDGLNQGALELPTRDRSATKKELYDDFQKNL